MDRITQMVRWTGLLLAYLALPLACLTSSKALGGERDEIGLASYYSQNRKTASGEPITQTRSLARIGPCPSGRGARHGPQDGQTRGCPDQ